MIPINNMKHLAKYLNHSILILFFVLLAGTCFIYSPGLMQGTATAKMFWL